MIRVASSKDMGFTIDIAQFHNDKNENNKEDYKINPKSDLKFFVESTDAICALDSKWPFVSMGGLEPSTVLILNAYDPICMRITIPDKQDQILSTFITNTNNLYILTQRREVYNLWLLDLDLTHKDDTKTKIKVERIKWYHSKEVLGKPFLKMHVRAPSTQEEVDNNEELVVFLLHQNLLYRYI